MGDSKWGFGRLIDWKALVVAEALYFYSLIPLIYTVLRNKLKRDDLFILAYSTGALLPLYAYTANSLQWMIPVLTAHFMAIVIAKTNGHEMLLSPYPYLLGASIMAMIYLKSVIG